MSRREWKQEKSGKRDLRRELEQLEQEEEQFRQLLGVHLEGWDDRMQPGIPTGEAMTALVREHKQEMRVRFRRELLLFWLVSILVLGGMMLLLLSNVVLFAVFQAIAVAVGVFVAWRLAAASAKGQAGEERRS
ncbi:DUF5345 family protein [Paenibacillus silvisoli]|uniref:DUF5345 family protein n=1 Tax=Paenibacillus silvisoli TaxID=3110539 RepID=UPI0028065A81|nr:DUF5345 family protein [Paenibacillus silvisoli]